MLPNICMQGVRRAAFVSLCTPSGRGVLHARVFPQFRPLLLAKSGCRCALTSLRRGGSN